VNLASAQIMEGNFDEALAAAKKAVKLEPDFPMSHNNLAVAYYYTKDFQAAKNSIAEAARLGYPVDPNFIKAVNEKA
jgi:Flp pilus assembly protein TadD